MAEAILFSAAQLTGRSRSHIVEVEQPRCSLHYAVVQPFLQMRLSAIGDGIDLVPASSFRDFARQLAIWNGKCRGERALYGARGEQLDPHSLSGEQLVAAILHWSALPGASRHHWGTDMDLIDAAAVPEGYTVRFVPEEYAPDGVFARLNQWLDRHAARHGFFRPYANFRGGVQPEPWHLSYAPVAAQALAQFSTDMLREALEQADLAAADPVRRQLPGIVERYVRNIDAPVPAVMETSSSGTRPA